MASASSRPFARFVFFGCLCAFVEGAVFPVYSVILGEIIAVMNQNKPVEEVNKYVLRGGLVG